MPVNSFPVLDLSPVLPIPAGHQAFLPVPCDDVAKTRPTAKQISDVIYDGKPCLSETGRKNNVKNCSPDFIRQIEILFNKMKMVEEFAPFFDGRAYAVGGRTSPDTCFYGQFVFSLKDSRGGLYPGASNEQLIATKQFLERLCYFYLQLKQKFPRRIAEVQDDLKEVVVCGPGSFEKLYFIDQKLFQPSTSLDGWLARLRLTTLETIASELVLEKGIYSAYHIHMMIALRKAAYAWGLSLPDENQQFDDRFYHNLGMTKEDYDVAFVRFMHEYSKNAIQCVVTELRVAITDAFNALKSNLSDVSILFEKLVNFNRVLGFISHDFLVEPSYFLKINDDQTVSLQINNEMLTNVVLGAFAARGVLNKSDYLVVGNGRYVFQYSGKVVFYDSKESSLDDAHPIFDFDFPEHILPCFPVGEIERIKGIDILADAYAAIVHNLYVALISHKKSHDVNFCELSECRYIFSQGEKIFFCNVGEKSLMACEGINTKEKLLSLFSFNDIEKIKQVASRAVTGFYKSLCKTLSANINFEKIQYPIWFLMDMYDDTETTKKKLICDKLLAISRAKDVEKGAFESTAVFFFEHDYWFFAQILNSKSQFITGVIDALFQSNLLKLLCFFQNEAERLRVHPEIVSSFLESNRVVPFVRCASRDSYQVFRLHLEFVFSNDQVVALNDCYYGSFLREIIEKRSPYPISIDFSKVSFYEMAKLISLIEREKYIITQVILPQVGAEIETWFKYNSVDTADVANFLMEIKGRLPAAVLSRIEPIFLKILIDNKLSIEKTEIKFLEELRSRGFDLRQFQFLDEKIPSSVLFSLVENEFNLKDFSFSKDMIVTCKNMDEYRKLKEISQSFRVEVQECSVHELSLLDANDIIGTIDCLNLSNAIKEVMPYLSMRIGRISNLTWSSSLDFSELKWVDIQKFAFEFLLTRYTRSLDYSNLCLNGVDLTGAPYHEVSKLLFSAADFTNTNLNEWLSQQEPRTFELNFIKKLIEVNIPLKGIGYGQICFVESRYRRDSVYDGISLNDFMLLNKAGVDFSGFKLIQYLHFVPRTVDFSELNFFIKLGCDISGYPFHSNGESLTVSEAKALLGRNANADSLKTMAINFDDCSTDDIRYFLERKCVPEKLHKHLRTTKLPHELLIDWCSGGKFFDELKEDQIDFTGITPENLIFWACKRYPITLSSFTHVVIPPEVLIGAMRENPRFDFSLLTIDMSQLTYKNMVELLSVGRSFSLSDLEKFPELKNENSSFIAQKFSKIPHEQFMILARYSVNLEFFSGTYNIYDLVALEKMHARCDFKNLKLDRSFAFYESPDISALSSLIDGGCDLRGMHLRFHGDSDFNEEMMNKLLDAGCRFSNFPSNIRCDGWSWKTHLKMHTDSAVVLAPHAFSFQGIDEESFIKVLFSVKAADCLTLTLVNILPFSGSIVLPEKHEISFLEKFNALKEKNKEFVMSCHFDFSFLSRLSLEENLVCIRLFYHLGISDLSHLNISSDVSKQLSNEELLYFAKKGATIVISPLLKVTLDELFAFKALPIFGSLLSWTVIFSAESFTRHKLIKHSNLNIIFQSKNEFNSFILSVLKGDILLDNCNLCLSNTVPATTISLKFLETAMRLKTITTDTVDSLVTFKKYGLNPASLKLDQMTCDVFVLIKLIKEFPGYESNLFPKLTDSLSAGADFDAVKHQVKSAIALLNETEKAKLLAIASGKKNQYKVGFFEGKPLEMQLMEKVIKYCQEPSKSSLVR